MFQYSLFLNLYHYRPSLAYVQGGCGLAILFSSRCAVVSVSCVLCSVFVPVSFPGSSHSVAPRSILGRPQLVHLGDALFELDVLAFLVGVSLVLRVLLVCRSFVCLVLVVVGPQQWPSYLALPREVVGLVATPVQRDEKVGAAVAVGHGQFGIAHLLASGLCFRLSQPLQLASAFFAGSGRVPGGISTPSSGD